MNLYRTAQGGRNFEYCSENPVLACTNGNDLMLEMGLASSDNVVDEVFKNVPVGITIGLWECAHNICYSILNDTKVVE